MDAAVIVAIIALAGTLGTAVFTYYLNETSERREAAQKRDAVWARYQGSLAFAADELAQRILNILGGNFLDAYGRGAQKDEAILSTLFRFAQYFGWSEILRQAMRAPDPRHAAEVKTLRDGQRRVGRCFATDDPYGAGAFMVWSEAQRAIGELMIKHDGEVTDTIGVADFWAEFEKFRPWLHRMQRLMETMTPDDWYGEVERLADVQSALESLSDKLGHESRYLE